MANCPGGFKGSPWRIVQQEQERRHQEAQRRQIGQKLHRQAAAITVMDIVWMQAQIITSVAH